MGGLYTGFMGGLLGRGCMAAQGVKSSCSTYRAITMATRNVTFVKGCGYIKSLLMSLFEQSLQVINLTFDLWFSGLLSFVE